MGYAVLGVAVDGALLSGEEAARSLAIVGATIEMVTHGLITGSLLLLSGSVWQHGHEYESGTFGGLSGRAPALAAFATLAAIALLGVLVTAALFLQRLQRLLFACGRPSAARWLSGEEAAAVEARQPPALMRWSQPTCRATRSSRRSPLAARR